MLHVSQPLLDRLPPELRLEITSYIGSNVKDVASLSSCSHLWRQFCLPQLLQCVVFQSTLPNEVIARFVIQNVPRHGRLIKEIRADAFQSDKYPDDIHYIRWLGSRDSLLAMLIALAPNLRSLQLCWGAPYDGSRMTDGLSMSISALNEAASLRRLVIGCAPEGDTVYDHITSCASKLDELVIAGDPSDFLHDLPHVRLGSSVMHLKRLALSYVNISTLFDICSFPFLTHLHLNVKADMASILSAISTIQDTLLYLSLDGDCSFPRDFTQITDYPLLSLPNLGFLRLCWIPDVIYPLFQNAPCQSVATDNQLILGPLLQGGGFLKLQCVMIVKDDDLDDDLIEPSDSFIELCAQRGIVVDQSQLHDRLPPCLAVNDHMLD